MCWVRTALTTGSTAMAQKAGLRSFRTSLQPVMVPPVPTPATKQVIVPSVCSQISGPVVS